MQESSKHEFDNLRKPRHLVGQPRQEKNADTLAIISGLARTKIADENLTKMGIFEDPASLRISVF